eukprot:CAMPEP_0196762350 /NCGR_PEP_ID=MMETSP1095-20130614/1761_1 /TAXON_ID=96789 ORGANISM="Chromulina nebulosa, Strain UTEXLB2642" /NCGR_SAMPLE_ID=MMETSP1095 /ASSEMBLY_ACC=CAM_ASM_000446 /LENGTH=293 /DNA_ID=CAMNT_0042113017 /DNA_START=34 /DNA_END=912 /DNA_ORIENTATION=-
MPIYDTKSIILKQHLSIGFPTEENFAIETSTINSDDIPNGGILLQVLVASSDPYLRGRMRPEGDFVEGKVIKTFVSGKVLHSNNENWVSGDLLGGSLPLSSYQIIPPELFSQTAIWKLTGLIDESEISLGIGILGMPGSTAYGGLIDVLRPNEGETIFISAAAGAVGSLVGILAKKLYNCKVIGSCGGDEKVKLVKEKYGFDHVIDYKKYSTVEELTKALKEVAPEGIDMYFENVGGIHFEAALNSLRVRGRIAVCGTISDYNSDYSKSFSKIIPIKMVYSQQRIEGFMCAEW